MAERRAPVSYPARIGSHEARTAARRSALATLRGALAAALLASCGGAAPFPLPTPLARDTDLNSVALPCREAPTEKDPKHVSCAPEPFVSPLAWDAADNSLFRPLSEALAVRAAHEAANADVFDEVVDSAWFVNRIGVRPFGPEELARGACVPDQILDPEHDRDGTWVIDKGKADGASPGFRVHIPGKGKYLLKSDAPVFERPSGASVIGAALYHAAGFYTSCEQVVYVRPALLRLEPGLRYAGNFGGERAFDEKALQQILDRTPKRGGLVRFQASAWLPGVPIGPFRYFGTRRDDPNDAIPHEDRRELRGGRLLAAWINHFDARTQNSMDVWMADDAGSPDSSPGKVLHYYIDTSDSLGSEWDWDHISRRLGHSYLLDWGDIGADFVTFGIPTRPWETVRRSPGHEIFGYFDVEHFVPEDWKMEYPNAAFSRMTERDGAWMARILSHFTPEMVDVLATLGDFSDPGNTSHIAAVLKGRLERILRRYLTRLSPIAHLRVSGGRLCGVNLAERRGIGGPRRYTATVGEGRALAVERFPGGGVCVALPAHAAEGAAPAYFVVTLRDGASRGPLEAHLYDLGPKRGFHLAGVVRPEA